MRKKLICISVVALLISLENKPRRNGGISSPVEMFMMSMVTGAEGAIFPDDGIHPPGPAFKEWRLNTNLDNVLNWNGLGRGEGNCSQNIYSFPSWYQEEYVMTLPKTFIGKQIILPVNGHFVFREGIHELFSSKEDTCDTVEVTFARNGKADWYDPDNWSHWGNKVKSGDNRDLLNAEGHGSIASSFYSSSLSAIPHVERAPCQYDSVGFPGNSSFNLKISLNVTIAKFYHGDKKLSYADVAILMNSPLGKLQFQKAPETIFSIREDENGTPASKKSPVCSSGTDADTENCICSNYFENNIKKKICALATCDEELEEKCPNPITPHGFCCPICGFHIKVRHTGNLKLLPIYTKLETEVSQAKLVKKGERSMISGYVSRYKEKGAHIILLPQVDYLNDLTLQRKLRRIVGRVESFLKQDGEVIEVTLTESWGGSDSDGGGSDRLESSGVGGGIITLIVFLVLTILLGGIALFIFMWNRQHGYPTLTLSSMTSALPRMSSMRIPIVPGVGSGGGGGRRSSTLSSSLHSFGFARFTNERMSTVTISPGESGSSSSVKDNGLGKSSSIRRTSKVDDEPLPITGEEEKTIDANSGAFGFTNVTYDLVAGEGNDNEIQDGSEKETKNAISHPRPVLTIPEVTIVELADNGSAAVPPPLASSSSKEEKSKEKQTKEKSGRSGFGVMKLSKAYQKLGSDSTNEAERKGNKSNKKKGQKKNEGTFKAKRLEEEGDSDEDIDVAEKRIEEVVQGQTSTSETAATSTGSPDSARPQEEEVDATLVNLEE